MKMKDIFGDLGIGVKSKKNITTITNRYSRIKIH